MAILMTEQLAKQLIEHYEQCISEVKECDAILDAKKLCSSKQYKTCVGLCYVAIQIFNQDVYDCKWIKSEVRKNSKKLYIADSPNDCETIPDIITALQTRVDILKTFKNENND